MSSIEMVVLTGIAFALSCYIIHRTFFYDKWASMSHKIEKWDKVDAPRKPSRRKTYIPRNDFDERITRSMPVRD